jgi:CheY-like chemotaxis protein
MKEVFILSDYTQFFKELTKQLGFSENEIISLPSFENESSWHDWTTQLFKDNTISKLVLPISIPTDNPINTEGLKMALHIRLNYELTLSQRLTPIILLSDFNIENILGKNNFDTDNNPQNLLFTKGIYLSSFDTEEITKTVSNAESCLPKDYQRKVLNKLNILAKASTGKHSITNAWGCFKLAQVTGLRDEIFKHNAISGHLKTLYSKYLICYNDAFTQEKRIDLNPIKCNGKKILFIDDQADEGWGDLMKNIFKGAGNNFVFIDSAKYKNSETKLFHDFEGFLTECRSHIGNDWDLIIIDLRLNPEKEDIDNEMISPTEFSGYKLIDEFLTKNEGYQVIVSTASNKIWNINAALKRGASSFYVKESPEFNYSISETNKHYEIFKNDVQNCFGKSYLRDIYKDYQQLIQNLNNQSTSSFINEIRNQLSLAYSLLYDAKTDIQFAYAYISLYMIIEIINNEYYTKKSDDKWEIKGVGNLLDWKWNTNSNIYSNSCAEVSGNKPPEWQKLAGIYYQKWNLIDHNFIQQLYFLITKRNGFVHGDKSILDKQDTNGKYLNHDIYTNEGYEKLFKHIKNIIGYLKCANTAHI